MTRTIRNEIKIAFFDEISVTYSNEFRVSQDAINKQIVFAFKGSDEISRQPAVLNRNAAGRVHRIDAFLKLLMCLVIGLMMNALTPAAAIAADLPLYSFDFDLQQDDQHAVVLDFWYGNSRSDWWINLPNEYVKQGTRLGSEHVTQQMPPGGLLYVKWSNTDTRKVFEDTVDLRHRLPKNIENHKVYLMIRGAQLYVYLVSPERRSPDLPSDGPSMYDYRKVTTIYPDQTKP